jgi:hypothetical protein
MYYCGWRTATWSPCFHRELLCLFCFFVRTKSDGKLKRTSANNGYSYVIYKKWGSQKVVTNISSNHNVAHQAGQRVLFRGIGVRGGFS